jgi:hypothetical protein
MLEFDWKYIPLSLDINDGIATFVIDNSLLGSSRFGSFRHYPYRAFGIVLQLFHNKHTREVFPQKLYNVLDTEFNIPPFFYHDLLVGEGDQGKFHHALKLDMSISEDATFPIQLSNIQYCHGYSFTPLNRTISLSTKQALYLFANILLNDRVFHYKLHFRPQTLIQKPLTEFMQFIHEKHNWAFDRYGKSITVLNQFAFVYYQHIYSELLSGNLSPEAFLCYNGATSLAYLRDIPPVKQYILEVIQSLRKSPPSTFIQQVLYYTLLYSADKYSKTTDDEVFRFIDDGSVTSKNSYDKLVRKEFPDSDKTIQF